MPVHIPVKDFAEDFAKSIKQIDQAMQSIAAAGIKEETIVTLIKEQYGSQIKKEDIRATLRTLGRLKQLYLTEKK